MPRLSDIFKRQWLIDRLQTINIVALTARVDALEANMGQLRDYVTAVRSETDRLSGNIKAVAQKLQDAIDAGDPSALSDLGDAVSQLHNAGDQLEAMATGTSADPLPTPAGGGSGSDSSGTPIDETGTSGGVS